MYKLNLNVTVKQDTVNFIQYKCIVKSSLEYLCERSEVHSPKTQAKLETNKKIKRTHLKNKGLDNPQTPLQNGSVIRCS